MYPVNCSLLLYDDACFKCAVYVCVSLGQLAPDKNKTCQAVQKHIFAKNTYTISICSTLSRDWESKQKPIRVNFLHYPRSLHTMCYYNGRFSFTHRHPYITRSLHSIHSRHIWCSNDSFTVTIYSMKFIRSNISMVSMDITLLYCLLKFLAPLLLWLLCQNSKLDQK